MMVGRVGPAFSVDEVAAAHEALDRAGAPRYAGEKGEHAGSPQRALTLPERIAWLHGRLVSARMAGTLAINVTRKRAPIGY